MTQPNDNTVKSGTPNLPLRFWIMVEHGLMTLEQAKDEWAKRQAAGEEFNALG